VCAAGAVLWVQAESRRDRVRVLARLAPGLTPSMARHLALDDSVAFRRFALETGSLNLRNALGALWSTVESSSPEAYERSSAAIDVHYRRIAVALVELYSTPDYIQDLETRNAFSPEKAVELRRLVLESQRLRPDQTADSGERITRLNDLLEGFQSLGYDRGVMLIEIDLASEVMKSGLADERLRHLRLALEAANRIDATMMKCQVLGELGFTYRTRGLDDSMRACYDEALTIARRCRIPEQLSRILQFRAGYEVSQGRLAAATDLVVEARRQCREMGGGGLELQFVVGAMDHFADLGCWEITEQLLEHCPALIRELDAAPQAFSDLKLSIDRQRVRILVVHGKFDEATALLHRIEGPFRRIARPRFARLLDDVTALMVERGGSAYALPWIEKGLANCDSISVPEHAIGLALHRAQALLATGDLAGARSALHDFDRRAAQRLDVLEFAVDRDVLDAHLHAKAGDRIGAQAALDRGLRALRAQARTLDAGPQGYLAIAAHDDLRDAMHGVLADPTAGYRFEMEWRSLPGDLGQGTKPASRILPTPSIPSGALHCVYRVGETTIVRWSTSGGSIRRDTLSISPAECSQAIHAIVSAMSDSGGLTSVESPLRRLSLALLPPQAFASSSPKRQQLFLSTDGPLARLPFELLRRPSDDAPLCAQWDVAYLDRPASPRGPLGSGAPSILGDPSRTNTIRRGLAVGADLAEALLEADSVAHAWRGARVLKGAQATKHALMASWRNAPRIHIATHLLRNPEIPFIAFFPLAMTPGAAPDEGYLEMADVRSTDLRGCELVILSACASGAPYRASDRRLGPSMGDAFLDAGARAVIQTSWPVADRDARRFVERFVSIWKPGTDPVAALADTRRAFIRDDEPPRVWAAWSIHLAGTPWSRPAAPTLTSSLARVP
jgi:hypothetical protein